MTQLDKNLANYTQINPILWEFMKESIYSSLEDSGLCLTGRDESTSTLSIMVSFIRPGGDRRQAFKTLDLLSKASQITTLPSEDLKSIAYTSALVEEWNYQRFWSLLLAKCFLFSLLGVNEELLEQEVRESLIKRWDAKLIEQSAYRYEALYKLIKKGFKHLKKTLNNDLVNKTFWDVFLEICREEIDFHFEVRTRDFQQFLIDTWIPYWEESANEKINREDLTPLLETQKHFHSQRLLEVLAILVKKAKRDTSLRARLTTYFNECIELADLVVQALKTRDSSGKVHKSEQWELGKRSDFHNNRPLKRCYKT
jgi:hypothetical protein